MKRLCASALFLLVAASAALAVNLNGAGATFPYPIYSKWFYEYNKVRPDVQINYQSIGSGGGIRQVSAGTVDFGASDMPLSDEQLRNVKIPIFQFPTVLGALVPTYHLSGVSAELKFTPEALAGIYLGTIKNWNDKALTSVNPGLNLPNKPIIVVHRSDGSGTTFVWTDYLSKISPQWKSKVGCSTAVQWPVGLGAKGNEGVAGMVRQMDGSVGYVELIYALQNKMQLGSVRNSTGKIVKASMASTTAAGASVKNMPEDFRISITNAPGADTYPIASFTYLLVPKVWKDKTKKDAFVQFLNWMLEQGQSMVERLDYAPLPQDVRDMEKAKIQQIR
jgi:phosphate transport system substrate-binding protein